MFIKREFFILIIFFAILPISAQNIKEEFLQTKTYDSLIILYDIYASDTIKIKKIAFAFINRAKEDRDSLKIAKGYLRLASVSRKNKIKKYIDSAIFFSKHQKDHFLPATAYIQNSKILFHNEEYEKSLKNALEAYHFANKNNNIDQQIVSLQQISKVNELWGDYKKALETELFTNKLIHQNSNKTFFEENYLYNLEGIGKCYVKLKKPDSALFYFKKGIFETLKKKDTSSYLAFVSRTAMALFEKGLFQQALDSLKKGDVYKTQYNKRYLSYYYYYAGSSYYNLGDKQKGINYLLKIDSIYEKTHVLNPELPSVYDKLISFYNEQNNLKKELFYLYKQIRVNRIISVKKIYIKEKTENDFFIPKLLENRDQIIDDLNTKNKNSKLITGSVLLLLLLLMVLLGYYIRRQKLYRKRFQQIIKNQKQLKDKAIVNDRENSTIPIETIKQIMDQLDIFEKEEQFLSSNLTMHKMAKTLQTNSSYLSKVINLKKDKNFSQYLNDLRIDYAVKEIDSNPKFRKYTIKAIANESGFKSAESFSKAFYKRFGLYPSYYLRQLKNK
ncbi:MAG: helix-turn-helix domain-containing protein [Flavobacteriales bacterium]